MNRGDRIIDDMRHLLTLFAPRCADRTTLDALDRMLSDDERLILQIVAA